MNQQGQRDKTSPEKADRQRMPGWVRVLVVVGVIAVAIIVTAMLVGGNDHGPGRHQPDVPVETSTSHVPPVDHG